VLRTAVVIDERYEEHQTGYGHPERASKGARHRFAQLLAEWSSEQGRKGQKHMCVIWQGSWC
jgi:hypothetical protein